MRIAELIPANYQRHLIHGEHRIWPETNCYSDVILELLHGFGLEPIAVLPFTLCIDFEGDQWTFFKVPDADLYELYGWDIQELAVWKSLPEHIAEQVIAKRPVLVELDSFFLPDTAGSAYKIAHMKTTVAVNQFDRTQRFLGYFHNQGYYELRGADFDDIFQLNGLVHERMLPPYIEYVKTRSHFIPPTGAALVEASLVLLKRHLQRTPLRNPFVAFKARFEQDVAWLMTVDIDRFHAYSFVNLRQYGACFELTATYLKWLCENGSEVTEVTANITNLEFAATAFQHIAESTKALQFQLARSMARKKPLDLSPLDQMAEQWQAGMNALRVGFG